MIVSSVWFGPDGRVAHRVGYSWVTPELLQGGLLCAAFGALPAWVTLWVTLWVTWWVTLGGSLSCMQFQIRGLPNQLERCSMAELSCCLPCLLFIFLLLLGHARDHAGAINKSRKHESDQIRADCSFSVRLQEVFGQGVYF